MPGQYDQRADSAAQCIQLLTAGERPVVQYAKIIAVKGDITDDEFEKIKNYIINPVESRVASLEIPESLDIKSSIPADIARIDGFIEMSDEEIKAYHASMGFAMSIAVTQALQSLKLLIHIGLTTAVTPLLQQSLTKSKLTAENIPKLSTKL